jgi:Sigma-70, region 4
MSESLNKTSIIRHFDPSGDISSFKREVRIDQNLLEMFFSNSDGLYAPSDIQIELENDDKINEINYIIEHMLPEIEKFVILLLFFYKKKQEVVGRILRVSQEMVCYYKKRALKRINLLCFFRNIDITKMEAFLDQHVTKKQKVAMLEYFKDHDLRRIAKKIGKDEGKISLLYESIGSRIKLGLKRLDYLKKSSNTALSREAGLYHKVFSLLKKYNSLYHTQSKKRVNKEISV